MLDLLVWFQLALSAFVAIVVGERAKVLLLDAPISEGASRFLVSSLSAGQRRAAQRWSQLRSRTHVGRFLGCALARGGEADAVSELLLDLRDEAFRNLMLLRVCATLSSTLGLLVAILLIRGGFSQSSGLLALQAGLAERVVIGRALRSMAIGVGTSALCFFALAIFRRRASQLLSQLSRFALLVGDRPA